MQNLPAAVANDAIIFGIEVGGPNQPDFRDRTMPAVATSFAMANPQRRDDTESPQTHGLILGRSFDFTPAPPAEDILGNPLAIVKLPAYELPHDTLGVQLSALLVQLGAQLLHPGGQLGVIALHALGGGQKGEGSQAESQGEQGGAG